MKTCSSSKKQQRATWQQRLIDRLHAALGPMRRLLARGNAALAGIAQKPAANPRRSVMITLRRSDLLDASATNTAWSERPPCSLGLIPVRIASAQRNLQGKRSHRHE